MLRSAVQVILFLDFDGVLHPETDDAEQFCRTPHLWTILQACPHVQVVFSTSWREMLPLKELVRFVIQDGGEEFKLRFLGVTPTIDIASISTNLGRREKECLAWLEKNRHLETPWLALDDIEYLFSPSSPNLYLTDWRHGLTETDVANIITRVSSTD